MRGNRLLLWLTMLVLLCTQGFVTACSGDDDEPVPVVVPQDDDNGSGTDNDDDSSGTGNDSIPADSIPADSTQAEPADTVPPTPTDDSQSAGEARLTGEATYSKYPLLRNLNFVYPSTSPTGEPVMLSGTITMSRSMTPTEHARGIILYNHYTVCRADECPSRGKLDMQNTVYLTAAGRDFITVSADYYGFGATEDRMQAYCIASANARASVDALLAARQLLAAEGYTWDDVLLNVGYSQGGQTAIGVLKVATEKHPDLHFTQTLAGGGPYDLEETYRQYLAEGTVALPSAVVSILLAYNEYCGLGIPMSSMFRGPTLQHLEQWWLSKHYSSSQIDRLMGTGDITQFVAPELLDLSTETSRRMMEALSSESLCRNWTPRRDEHILLLHHNSDDISPAMNTQHLYDYLKAQGVDDVELRMADFLSLGLSEHVSGGAAFLTLVAQWIIDHYPS